MTKIRSNFLDNYGLSIYLSFSFKHFTDSFDIGFYRGDRKERRETKKFWFSR